MLARQMREDNLAPSVAASALRADVDFDDVLHGDALSELTSHLPQDDFRRGYALLNQMCRGTFDSDGYPAWLAAQRAANARPAPPAQLPPPARPAPPAQLPPVAPSVSGSSVASSTASGRRNKVREDKVNEMAAPPPPSVESSSGAVLELFFAKEQPGGGYPTLHIYDPDNTLDYDNLDSKTTKHAKWVANVSKDILNKESSLNQLTQALLHGGFNAYKDKSSNRKNIWKTTFFINDNGTRRWIDDIRTSRGGQGFKPFRLK